MIYPDEHAFPNGRIEHNDMVDIQRGMDLRTYLTGQAFAAAAIYCDRGSGVSLKLIAEKAVQIADAAIIELNSK